MKTTTEMEIKVSGGRIVGAEVSADSACKLTMEVKAEENPKDVSSKNLATTSGGYGPGMSAFWDDEWDQTGCCGD